MEHRPLEPNGAYVVVKDAEGRVLVLFGTFGFWMLPGGGIKPLELPKDAAVRETLHESGFHLDRSFLDSLGHYAQTVVERTDAGVRIVPVSGIVFLFRAGQYGGDLLTRSNHEILERRFMHIEDILALQERKGNVRTGDLRMILHEDQIAHGFLEAPFEEVLRKEVRFRDTNRHF